MSTAIACPECSKMHTTVIDSRPYECGGIRRRRVCNACGYRFTTLEEVFEGAALVDKMRAIVSALGNFHAMAKNELGFREDA